MNERGDTRVGAAFARGPTLALGLRLFALSFVSLFLEMMVIRWAPSVVRLIAYYANLMLISSFLGLGIGAMLAESKRNWFPWFAPLLATEVAVLLLFHEVVLAGTASEARFFAATPAIVTNMILVSVFAANCLVFVPLGQEIGRLFRTLAPLSAYTWDLGGSLLGTLCFGLFSLQRFSPLIGFTAVAVVITLLQRSSGRLTIPVFCAILTSLYVSTDQAAIWSPYHYVAVHDLVPGQLFDRKSPAVAEPAEGLRSRRDPPLYTVTVNQDFYQVHGSLDVQRYTPGSALQRFVEESASQYLLPYQIGGGRERAVVLGAGGGMDVEAALLSGMNHVEAVEIDPRLVQLSRRFSAADVYDDPRVSVRIDDARAFLRNAKPGYDFVVFGFLDSQALFSIMSSLRLDGFVYTVESLRTAYGLLADDGVLSLSFVASQPWLANKLLSMVIEATGRIPILYFEPPTIILMVPRGAHTAPAANVGPFRRVDFPPGYVYERNSDVATDDWPYLYLSHRTIPRDYLVVIGVLMTASIACVMAVRGRGFGWNDGHFLFLGLGFLLLETRAISDCSLYFGTTWFVTMLVVSGVLAMVLAANLVALRLPRSSLLLYAPLFAALIALYIVPRDSILSFPFAGRMLWTMFAVPLPVFFAGLVFSTSFRHSQNPSALFGANLVGATLGGFCEYLGMAIGSRGVFSIVIAAYAASLACRSVMSRRSALV